MAALGDGMRERRRREWYEAEGEAVSAVGRRDPGAGCRPTDFIAMVAASPPLPDPASRVPRAMLRGAMALRSLEIINQATSVARLMIIPILTATRSARICSGVPRI